MTAVNHAIGAALALLLAGCATTTDPVPGAGVPTVRIASRLTLDNLCNEGRSPPVAVENPPAGATTYSLRLTNISVLVQTPRDWAIPVPADPRRIPLGALPGYQGPCPGQFQDFTYRLELVARGAGGEALGYGQTRMIARSLNTLAQQQWRTAGQMRAELEQDPDAEDAGLVGLYDTTDRAFETLNGGTGYGRRNELYVPR